MIRLIVLGFITGAFAFLGGFALHRWWWRRRIGDLLPILDPTLYRAAAERSHASLATGTLRSSVPADPRIMIAHNGRRDTKLWLDGRPLNDVIQYTITQSVEDAMPRVTITLLARTMSINATDAILEYVASDDPTRA